MAERNARNQTPGFMWFMAFLLLRCGVALEALEPVEAESLSLDFGARRLWRGVEAFLRRVPADAEV